MYEYFADTYCYEYSRVEQCFMNVPLETKHFCMNAVVRDIMYIDILLYILENTCI